MQRFSTSPREMVASLWRNHKLIAVLVKREVVGRYRGSMLGILWPFFQPALMLAIYTFVFSVVFKARWNSGSDSKTEFALILFSGLLVFNFFAECINRAPGLIHANANYVKKVVFPLDVLPWVALGAAFFHTFISLIVWFVFYVILFGLPHPAALFLPLIWLPLVLISIGFSWFLASLGVFLRDIAQVTGILTTVLMFLSPIFYPKSSLPEAYQVLFNWNPLAPTIEQTRNALMWGTAPDGLTLSVQTLAAALIAWLGFVWFQKTRKGFADVL